MLDKNGTFIWQALLFKRKFSDKKRIIENDKIYIFAMNSME